MNRIYRSVWNATLGVWVAAPETARSGGAAASTVTAGMLVAALLGMGSNAALAACSPTFPTDGSTVTCSGTTQSYLSVGNNLIFDILSGTVISSLSPSLGAPALMVTGTNLTVKNSGTIDPTGGGNSFTQAATGLKVEGSGGTNLNITNNADSAIFGVSGNLSSGLVSLSGMALEVTNPAGGLTSVTNNGSIGSWALLGTTEADESRPVVAISGGGAVYFVNSGSITGRVAFEGSSAGNTFTNSGHVHGSVSLGANSSNRFIAVTGSGVVANGVSAGALTGPSGSNLEFAPVGVVDGGANGNNNLTLRNPVNSGTSGTGTISSTAYTNFSNLVVQSGTWSVTGALLSGATTSVSLQGGALTVNNGAFAGSGTISASGGTLSSSAALLTLANDIVLGTNIPAGTNGLTLQGSNAITLNGVISGGAGASLVKNGTHVLRINGANTYTGGTTLNGGTTIVGTDQAFGTGGISIGASAGIDSSAVVTLDNNISLGGSLIFGGSSTLTAAGTISGGSADTVTKVGSGNLVLNGANTYQGGTLLSDGTLTVGNDQALGSGALTVNAATSLNSNKSVTLVNDIALNANLTLSGSNDLRVDGAITGNSGNKLTKTGSGNLTLGGANSAFAGGIDLNAGTLTSASSGVLGSGVLTATGNSRLAVTSAQTISAGITVNNGVTLELDTSAATTHSGGILGAGTLAKTGSADLLLTTANNFFGAWDVREGSLTTTAVNALGSDPGLNVASGARVSLGGNTDLTTLSGSGLVSTDSRVTVGYANVSSTFNGQITGLGSLLKVGSGTLTLAGINTYTGATTINVGRVNVAAGASLASNLVTVSTGGTLGGSGTVNAVTVGVGGRLALSSGSTLTTGSLTLSSGAVLDLALGAPTLTPMVNILGNLSITSSTFNIIDTGSLANGNYRLFNYSGNLTGTNLTVGSTPSYLEPIDVGRVFDIAGKTLTLVINSASLEYQYWNGSGTWNGSNVNWSMASNGAGPLGVWRAAKASFGGTAGVVTVEGTQSLTGADFITDGYSMVAGTSGALSLVNSIGGSANFATGAGVTAHISAPLTGAGRLLKSGAGTLVLAGDNSYTGGTALGAGTLTVRHNNALGTGSLALSGGSTLAADMGSVQLGNAVSVSGSANLSVASGTQLALNGRISGSGGLNKTGAGTLQLNGDNSYTGPTALTAGSLVLGHQNSLGLGALQVLGAAHLDTVSSLAVGNDMELGDVLTLDGSHDTVLAGAITGGGSLRKDGAATVSLTGVNSFSGGTIIVDGVVLASAASLGSGAITNNATLELNQASDATLAQRIGGTGRLNKTGAGTLTLTADSSGFAGSTTVQAGTLLVAANAQLGGHVEVASGSTLAGAGTVGHTTIHSGAILAPGDSSSSYGMLTVNGNLALGSGAALHIRANPGGSQVSSVHVTGTAMLAGNVLHVGNESNAATDFQIGKAYTILHASQILGTFGGATSDYAYLDAALGYLQTNGTTTDVTLMLQRKGSNTGGGNTGGGTIRFADLAETGNQRQAAQGVESLPSTHALYKYVETLPAGAPAAVFNSLSGDVQATVGGSLVGLGAFAPSISGQHLRNNMTAGFRAGAPVAQSDGPLPASAWPSSKALPAWAEVVGHWQRYDGDGNAAQLKQRTTGLFLGMDEEVGTSGWRVGGSVGYTNADGRVADRSSESDVNSYSAAVYGGKSFGTGTGPRINVLGGLAYTWHDIETTRRVTSLGQTLKADYSAHTAQLFAEVGYAIGQYDKVGFEPFAAVSLGQQRTGSFQERGGFAALQGRSSTDDLASTTLGLRVHSDFQLAGKEGRLRATVGWRHAFGDVTAKKTMAFEGGQNFTVAGTPLARNTAVLGLEADVALSRTAALVLGYQGEMGSGQRDHSASVKLRWAF